MRISVLTPTIRPGYLYVTQEVLEKQTFTDFEWLVEVGLHDHGFTLPSDMNKMLRRATGDIIVSLQDCIYLKPNALERIAALDHTKTAYTYPVGKFKLWDLKRADITWDWRKHMRPGGALIDPSRLELDFGSAPLQMFKDIGGYDEDYCNGWSFDNVEIALRADAAGYELKVMSDIRGEAIDHDDIVEHPHRTTLPLNNMRANNTRLRAGQGDYKLHFLT